MINKSQIIIYTYIVTLLFILAYCLLFPISQAVDMINFNPIAPDNILDTFKGGRALDPTDYVNNLYKKITEIWLATLY